MSEVLDWRLIRYLAPTWSWAACKKSCPIAYPSLSTVQFKVTILDAGVVTDGDNPFGRVSDGYAQLKGLLRRGAIKRLSADSLALDVVFEPSRNRVRQSLGYVIKHEDEIAFLPLVWYLQISLQFFQTFPSKENGLHWHDILILEEDVAQNVFRRLTYQNWLMTDADWVGAERKIIVIR